MLAHFQIHVAVTVCTRCHARTVPIPDIQKIYSRFMFATDGTGLLSKEALLSMHGKRTPLLCWHSCVLCHVAPLTAAEVANNPLHERLAVVFGVPDAETPGIDFKHFIATLSQLSPTAPREQKAKIAFTMYDVDGDGKISHKDLLDILSLTVMLQGLSAEEATKVLCCAVCACVCLCLCMSAHWCEIIEITT